VESCPGCNHQLQEDSQFCSSCGASLSPSQSTVGPAATTTPTLPAAEVKGEKRTNSMASQIMSALIALGLLALVANVSSVLAMLLIILSGLFCLLTVLSLLVVTLEKERYGNPLNPRRHLTTGEHLSFLAWGFIFLATFWVIWVHRPPPEKAKQSETVRQETPAKTAEARKNEDEFHAMSSAEHLERVKSLLTVNATPESLSQAVKHLAAIPPDTPEAVAAAQIKLQYDLEKRQQGETPADVVAEKKRMREAAAADKKNAIEAARDAEDERVRFAAHLENGMLDGGMDIKVRTGGLNHTTLFVQWILADRVLVHEWQKSLDFDALRSLGFRRIEVTDGYDHTWTWKLN
jgi:hypothetical protein